ncbi:hypothetical protein MN202_04515 [Rheinheimera muenzenbergensis]|uniref:Sel1 repeat-containing protein n=1 Tax=Rheinheimera muenzenbergensis TaxID=1193628 RepID=A0ABU8C3J4_9GAMM
MKLLSLCLIVVFVIGAYVYFLEHNRQTYEQGVVELKLGNVDRSVALLEQSAKRGSNQAVSLLAELYAVGKHVPADRRQALHYVNKLKREQKNQVVQAIVYALEHREQDSDKDELAFWRSHLSKVEMLEK